MKRSMTLRSPIAVPLLLIAWLRRCRGASRRGSREAPRRARSGGGGRRPRRAGISCRGCGLRRPRKRRVVARPSSSACARRARSIAASRYSRRHQILELELLLDAEREQLVGGLARLERADRALAARRQLGERAGIRLHILDDLRLDAHRLPVGRQSLHRAAPAPAATCWSPVSACAELAGKQRLELLVEPGDLELDALRLPHQLVDLLHRRL